MDTMKIAVALCVAVATSQALTSVPLYHSRNKTSHCAGTFITSHAVLTRAHCLINASSMLPLPALKVGDQGVSRIRVVPKWMNTTARQEDVGIAFVGSGNSPPADIDVTWNPYTIEQISSISVADGKFFARSTGHNGSLSLGQSRLVRIPSNFKLPPGTAISLTNGSVIALSLPASECKNGWSKESGNCGSRISKLAFDFICETVSKALPSCTNPLLYYGTDSDPVLLTTKAAYENLDHIPSKYGVILVFCDINVCSLSGNCTECEFCSSSMLKNWDSLDRLINFVENDVIVRRVDLSTLPAAVPYTPYVIFRPKGSHTWFQYRDTLSTLVSVAIQSSFSGNDPGVAQLENKPAMSQQNLILARGNDGIPISNMVKNGPDAYACQGQGKKFVTETLGFLAQNVLMLNHMFGSMNDVGTTSGERLFTLFPLDAQWMGIGFMQTPMDVLFVKVSPNEISTIRFQSYYVPYISGNNDIEHLPYVDIPRNPASNQHKFVLTGALSGCSVVVERNDESTARVYHDNNCEKNAAAWKNRPVLSRIDHDDYEETGKPWAVALLFYSQNSWKLIAQCQDRTQFGDPSAFDKPFNDLLKQSKRENYNQKFAKRNCPKSNRPDGLIVREIDFSKLWPNN